MNPADGVFLYSIASALDIFMIWTLVLTAIGFNLRQQGEERHGVCHRLRLVGHLHASGASIGAAFS